MSATEEGLPTKKQELMLFLILTVIMAPVVSLSIIGGYGLFIWLSQIIGGPPTH